MRKILWAAFGLVACLTACSDHEDWKKEARFYAEQCLSVDSIIDFAKDQDALDIRPYLSRAFNRFHFSGDSARADDLLAKIESLPIDSDSFWLHTAQMNHLFRAMWNQDERSFNALNAEYEQLWASADSGLVINMCNAAGSMEFARGNLDSAMGYFMRGLSYSEQLDRDGDIMQLASNVGTIYFYKSIPGLASYYFSLAVEAMERAQIANPMLVNNVISALGEEGKHKESLQYYEDHKSILRSAIDDYTRNTIQLNYAYVLSNMGRNEESSAWLDSLNFAELGDHLKIDYLNLEVGLLAERGLWSQANAVLDEHRDFIWSHSPQCLVRMAPILTGIADSGRLQFNWDRLRQEAEGWMQGEQLELNEKLDLLGLLKAGPFKAELKQSFAQRYRDQHYSYFQQSDSVRVSNIESLVTIGKLKREQERARAEMEQARENSRWLRTTAVLVTFMLFLLVVNLFQWRRDRARIEKELTLSLELEKQGKAILEQERSYTDRIRLLSEALIAKSMRWSEMIKSSHIAKDPVAIQIRRELETIATIKGNFEYDESIMARGESVEEALRHFPELEELSHTAKEVVLLSISGQKPREIAKLLSLNEQYIRNLKSSAKKQLAPRLGTKFRWEELSRTES
jgi:DNA-binding CsgD family transcriptional regulator